MKLLLLFLLVLAPSSLSAEVIEIMSGTGFYVSPDGHAITNEHVVKNCKSINLTSDGENR